MCLRPTGGGRSQVRRRDEVSNINGRPMWKQTLRRSVPFGTLSKWITQMMSICEMHTKFEANLHFTLASVPCAKPYAIRFIHLCASVCVLIKSRIMLKYFYLSHQHNFSKNVSVSKQNFLDEMWIYAVKLYCSQSICLVCVVGFARCRADCPNWGWGTRQGRIRNSFICSKFCAFHSDEAQTQS